MMKFKRLLALEAIYLQNTIHPACSIHQRPRINTVAPGDQFQRIQISTELKRGSLIYVYRKLSPDFSSKGHSTISYRNFRNFNRGKFRNDIYQQDWSCNSYDPNVLWADWKAKFLSIVNIHAPFRT